MDEAVSSVDIAEHIKFRNCPVKVGDRFYYNNSGTKNGSVLPDYIRVMEIKKMGDGSFAILGHYENHLIGPHERWYSSIIFDDNSWVIERKNNAGTCFATG